MPKANALKRKNVISKVEIHSSVQEAWLDSLAEVSRIMQKRINGAFVGFSEDLAVVNRNGILKLYAFIAGERVFMEVPEEYWRWKTHAAV